MLGQHCIKTWSSTQAIIATSSGEAEYYALVKASSVGIGCRSMLADLGHSSSLHVHVDSSASIGIASRMGLGKTRHIDVHYLWVQERVRNGDMVLHKVPGEKNPADLMTKHLTAPVMSKYMSRFHIVYMEGRSSVTPTI